MARGVRIFAWKPYPLQKAIGFRKDWYDPHHNIGVTYILEEQWELAIPEREESQRLDPLAWATQESLGWALENVGEWEAAFDEYQLALRHAEKEEEKARTHLYLGWLNLRFGDYSVALDHVIKA